MKNKGAIKKTTAALRSVMVQSSRNTAIYRAPQVDYKKRCNVKHGLPTRDQGVGRFTKGYNADKN